MVYPNQDAGRAIGEIVSAIADAHPITGIQIRMTSEEFMADIQIGEAKRARIVRKTEKTGTKKSTVLGKKGKRKSLRNARVVECDGKSMAIREWAEKLGVSAECVRQRIKKTGNPYGRKGPTDGDWMIASAQPACSESSTSMPLPQTLN